MLRPAVRRLEFAPGIVKAFVHLRPGYIPKVPTNVAIFTVMQAFWEEYQENKYYALSSLSFRCLHSDSCPVAQVRVTFCLFWVTLKGVPSLKAENGQVDS